MFNRSFGKWISKTKVASKSMLSIVLVLCLLAVMLPAGLGALFVGADVVPVWGGSSDVSTALDGQGTETDPYQIKSGADLAFLAQRVNEGGTANQYVTGHYKLTNDIDLNNQPWTPIGKFVSWTNLYRFKGTFDGGGHTISGLKCDGPGDRLGLFGTTQDATIQNIKIVAASVDTTGARIGGFVGCAQGRLTMTNCSFSGTVTSGTNPGNDTWCGGLVGQVDSAATCTLTNCSFSGNVTSKNTNGHPFATGGLVGYAGSKATLTLSGCSVTAATISGTAGVGGLVGIVNQTNADTKTTVNIQNSYCGSDVTIKGTYLSGSGLIGMISLNVSSACKPVSITMNNCYNAAQVMSEAGGGLLGCVRVPSSDAVANHPIELTLTNCHYAGSCMSGTTIYYPIMHDTMASYVTTKTVENVYYKEGSYITEETSERPSGATKKTVLEFEGSAVKDLLNTPAPNTVGTMWAVGADGYPVFASAPKMTDLSVSVGNIEFDPEDDEYVLVVSNDINSTTVTATVEDPATTTITVNGIIATSGTPSQTIDLMANSTTKITVVIDLNGYTKTYTIDVICAVTWNGTEIDSDLAGSGSKEDPYQITSGAELAYVAQEVNAKNTTYNAAYYKLMNDIDLGNQPWTPIGNSSSALFGGTFDGAGHTISGLNRSTTETGWGSNGLFGRIGGQSGNAAILENLHVQGTVSTNQASNGGIVGVVGGKAKLINCSFSGNVQGAANADDKDYAFVGGLVGHVSTDQIVLIRECHTTATTTVTSVKYPGASTVQHSTGGLIGCARYGAHLTIEDSYSAAAVNGGYGTGGLLGTLVANQAALTKVTIKNSYSTGTIDGDGWVGGLVGYLRVANSDTTRYGELHIEGSYSAATLSGAYSGGLYGALWSTAIPQNLTISIKNSHFAGSATQPIGTYEDTKAPNLTVENVYYKTGSGTATSTITENIDNGNTIVIDNVQEETAEKFSDGTVAGLLNDAAAVNGTKWTTGTDGYPVFMPAPKMTGLSVSCGTIEFDPSNYDYMLVASDDVTSATVTATVDDPTTTSITVNGVTATSGTPSQTIDLTPDGKTTITVVIDLNGYSKTYTIVVSFSAPPTHLITDVMMSGVAFSFDPALYTYTLSVPYSTDTLVVLPTVVENATAYVNGVLVQNGSVSQSITLAVGVPQVINLQVNLDNLTDTYSFRVTRREQAPSGAWDGSYEAFDTSNKKGTDLDNPIIIENEAQLAFLGAMVNGKSVMIGNTAYKAPAADENAIVYAGTYFKLAKDLKLNVLDDYENWDTAAPFNNWDPIGWYWWEDWHMSRRFGGTFDGDSHTITGLYTKTSFDKFEHGTGLFGAVREATIRNLHVKQSYVAGCRSVGGLVGRGDASTFEAVTLQNCSYSGILKSSAETQSRMGGLVGSVYPGVSINSCWSEGYLTGGSYLGGLLGWGQLYKPADIVNSYSVMTIESVLTTPESVGGLVGGAFESVAGLNIRRCHFAGFVNTNTPIVGSKDAGATYSMESHYYRADSFVGPVNEDLLFDAVEYSVEEFADGTVTELLNNIPGYGDFWNWKDGENGYPVSDGVILVTDFRTYTDDSNFGNSTAWADKFVIADGGILKNPNGNSGNDSDDFGDSNESPITGESSLYIAVVVLLLISAVSAFLLARRKRNTN